MRVGVIGAGPAGLTAAYQLAKAAQVDVFEASDAVGGLARSLRLWDQTVDLGPHRFFSSDARVNRFWLEIVGRDYKIVERLTRIYYRGRFFDYPLAAGNVLANLGPLESARCVLSYLRQKVLPSPHPAHQQSFESWVVARFGRRLFEIFFKSYSEKLWGIPCTQLDADFAAQRIRGFSLGQAVQGALRLSRTKHRTLVDRFAYPVQGTGMLYERMAEGIRHRGRVWLQSPVARVLHEGMQITGLETLDGRAHSFDHVVSTMPLTLLVRALGPAPPEVEQAAAALRFRNTILVYLHVDASDLFPDQWLYIHAPDLQTGRVTNFRNWIPELYGTAKTTIVALEYWCFDGDPIWSESDEVLIARATDEIARAKLSGGAKVLDGRVVRLPRCYPMYAIGYKEHLATIVEYLRGFAGLSVIGRYGAFKYNNQDHSILMGLLAAENVLEGAQHDLWSVNTDYESYQESALITESGLEPA